MKNHQTTPFQKQHGMTVLGALLLLIVIGFAVLIVMRIVPIYIDYFSIRSSLEGIRNEPGVQQRSPADIQKAIDRRFNISYVTILKAKDIKVVKKGGTLTLVLDYEDRRPLLYNLDVVGSFNEEIQIYP